MVQDAIVPDFAQEIAKFYGSASISSINRITLYGRESLLGSTVVSPYVGMARKQNGGYNASISVQTLIFHLVVNSTRLKTVRSALWRCPNSTVALRLLENVVKVTNLEVVKIEFRHLPVLLLSFFFSSQPSALTRAVLKTKHTQIAVKFFEDVPFELSF